MTPTPLNEIADLDDKVQVLLVEGTVKYAAKIENGVSSRGYDWSKQFFVLAGDDTEVPCTLWDAEGNEMIKDEQVSISATKNKKGQWSGIQKGSYKDKRGNLCHSLEIRANNVKINGTPARKGVAKPEPEPPTEQQQEAPTESAWPEAPPARRTSSREDIDEETQEEKDIRLVREHMMRVANLHNICIDVVNKVTGPHIRELGLSDFINPEFFARTVQTFFIEGSSRRSNDGVNWWSYLDKMPAKPIKKKE